MSEVNVNILVTAEENGVGKPVVKSLIVKVDYIVSDNGLTEIIHLDVNRDF